MVRARPDYEVTTEMRERGGAKLADGDALASWQRSPSSTVRTAMPIISYSSYIPSRPLAYLATSHQITHDE